MQPIISIIIPIYNSEKYLSETINAVRQQSIQNIEIILINDGSTDDTEKICKVHSNEDNRIKYIKQENSGPGAARNLGIQNAKGIYIGFCDSDDLPDAKMYETLYEYIVRNDSDIAMCDIYSERNHSDFGLIYEDGQILNRDMILFDLIPKMIGNNSDDDFNMPLWGSVVRCIYKKSLINKYNITFPNDIKIAEDLVFTLSVLSYSYHVSICNKVLYFYRLNENSLMMSQLKYQINMLEKSKKLTKYIEQIIKRLDMNSYYEKNRLVSFRSFVHGCIANACRKTKTNNLFSSYREIVSIVNDSEVIYAFTNYDIGDKWKRVVYNSIKYKRCLLILLFYKIRFIISKILEHKCIKQETDPQRQNKNIPDNSLPQG